MAESTPPPRSSSSDLPSTIHAQHHLLFFFCKFLSSVSLLLSLCLVFLLLFASDVHRAIPLQGSVHGQKKEGGAGKSGDPFPRLRLEAVDQKGTARVEGGDSAWQWPRTLGRIQLRKMWRINIKARRQGPPATPAPFSHFPPRSSLTSSLAHDDTVRSFQRAFHMI